MKKLIYPIAALMLMTASAFTFIQLQDWKITDNYSVKFDGGDPQGEFKGLKGLVQFDEKNLASSKFEVSIDVATINTGNGMKNTHAKSAGWFDVEKYPTITFTSSAIAKNSSGYAAKGMLEMHGVKKEITIPFIFSNNVFASNFEVNRNEFGIGDPKHEKVPATLKLSISVPVTK
jgi:polyisoprenoid-binding protein YceI